MATTAQGSQTPRAGEIEDDNELIDLDYLRENFDEEIEIPKEVEEEESVASLFKKDQDKLPARTVKEDIAKIKAKVKQKQTHPSTTADTVNETALSTGEENHSLETNEKLPSISKVYSEKPKLLQASQQREREQQKLPNLKLHQNKSIPPTKKTSSDKSSRSGDRPGGGPGAGGGSSRRDRDDELKSMDILRRREEEIQRSKIRREQMLREQEELLAHEDDLVRPLGGGAAPPFNPVTATERRRTKKKKPLKEFMVKYDSRSGLFGVDVEAERQSKLENYRIQRRMKRNAEQTEIQRARVRLHRHGAYDLYNQGTVSIQGRDLFHEMAPRPPPLTGEGERLVTVSDRQERSESDPLVSKRMVSAESSPSRPYPFHHNVQLSHVSHRSEQKVGNQASESNLSPSSVAKEKKKISPVKKKEEAGENDAKGPLFDFPDYLNDSPLPPSVAKKPTRKPKKKPPATDPKTEAILAPSPSPTRPAKDKDLLDIFESETPSQDSSLAAPPTEGLPPKRKDRKGKSKVKKGEEGSAAGAAEGSDVMRQLDIEFPDYLLDSSPGAAYAQPKSSPHKIRDLTRPTKASIAAQAQSQPRVDEKDLGKKKAERPPRKVKSSLPPPTKPPKARLSDNRQSAAALVEDKGAVQSLESPGSKTERVTRSEDPEKEEVYADEAFEEEDPLGASPKTDTISTEVPLVLTPLIVPQPPSAVKSQSFPRKNSSGSSTGRGSITNSPLSTSPNKPTVTSPPREDFVADPDELSGLVISGIKLPTPATESASQKDRFSPKTLRLDDKPRQGEDEAEETYEDDGFVDHGEGEEDLDAFLQGFVEKGQSTPSVDSPARRDEATSGGGAKAQREADAEGDEDYNYDFIDPESGENVETTSGQDPAAKEERRGEEEEEIVGGDEEREREGEGSLYDYGDDSFAPYESQGAGKTEGKGEGERKVGTEEPSAAAAVVDDEDSQYHDDFVDDM